MDGLTKFILSGLLVIGIAMVWDVCRADVTSVPEAQCSLPTTTVVSGGTTNVTYGAEWEFTVVQQIADATSGIHVDTVVYRCFSTSALCASARTAIDALLGTSSSVSSCFQVH